MPLSLSFFEKLRYSCTSAGINMISTTVSTWLLYFWSPPPDSGRSHYLDITIVGILLAIGRLWDAIIDPLIGHWSDGIQTRWGRRRPFIMGATPVMLLTLILLWTPPVSHPSLQNIIYFLFITTAFYTSFSLISIPYDGTLPEMASNSQERVSLSMWKNIFGTMGVLLGVVLAAFLFDSAGAVVMGVGIGIVGVLTIAITLTALRETVPKKTSPLKFKDSLISLLQNQPFLVLALSTVIVQTAYAMLLATIPYFVTVVLGQNEAAVSTFQGGIVLTMTVAAPVWNWLSKHYTQRKLLIVSMVGLAISISINFAVGWLPILTSVPVALGSLALLAPFLGGYFILVYAMMGSVVDYDEWLSGNRREALYYGTFSLSAGLGLALATLIVPRLFTIYGYSAENPLGIRMVFLVAAAMVFMGIFPLQGYRLGDTLEETKENLG